MKGGGGGTRNSGGGGNDSSNLSAEPDALSLDSTFSSVSPANPATLNTLVL